MSKKMFSRERERGKLRFSALLILIGLLLFGCDPTTVTITYNANGGEGEMKPQAVESGVEVKLIANAFTKAGSDFTGWNEAADGSGKAYADGATVTPTGNLTLYAQWQEKPAEEPEQPGEVTDPDEPGGEVTDPDEPGGEVTDPEQPEDPPVSLENHITNTAFIAAVEAVYPSIGWSKTEDGYVDMTVEANQTAVTGVESLDLSGQGLTSSEGLEYFTGLKQLTLSASKDGSDKQNALTELDVSALTALTSLVLNGNPLTALPDLTNQSALVSLNAASCGLTAVSGLPASLMILNLSDNELTALDVSALTNLASLLCYGNQMNALDITTLSSLNELYCGAQKTEGDLSLNATSEQLESLRNLFEGNVEDNALLLLNSDVVWIVPAKDFDLTAGTAVFDKTVGLTLPFGEGQALPDNVNVDNVDVSLGDNQVDSQHVSIKEDRTAIIVALAGLTNDTVDMTVTVTVSAAGYNDAELTYSGVNTVWMPENVTAALEAVSPENTFIEGEVLTVTLTADGESTGKIKITSAVADGTAISFTDSTITVPNVESGSVTLTLGKDGTEETVSAAVELAKIYDSTHVRYDGRIFQQVKGFDFSTENTAKTAGVKVKRGSGGVWNEKSNWETVTYSDGEGYTFTTNKGDGVRFVFPETDGNLDFELIMVETKWNNSNANIHLSWWYSDADIYGYSFYKGGKSFFMLDSYNYSASNGFDASVTANTFNRFYAFDDGTNHSGRVNDGDVKSFSFSDSHTLDSFTSIQLEFNESESCTYTLRTVNFYKPLSN